MEIEGEGALAEIRAEGRSVACGRCAIKRLRVTVTGASALAAGMKRGRAGVQRAARRSRRRTGGRRSNCRETVLVKVKLHPPERGWKIAIRS